MRGTIVACTAALLCGAGIPPSARGDQPPGASRPGLPVDELDRIWNDAERSGGVLAVEPETHVIGLGGARKKTYELADQFLKLYWGHDPIWFPADIVRRTVCGPQVRWSYFWHDLSGDERDLHPWFAYPNGFDQLLGANAPALAFGGGVDVASCGDVKVEDRRCLYAEITPPREFDAWFCGATKGACRHRLRRDPTRVNPEFQGGETFCAMGPWVQERVHGFRPEIHPAEVMWLERKKGSDWRFAVLADRSRRFQKDGDFAAVMGHARPRAWSRRRPLEFWIAFTADAPDRWFDLSVRTFGSGNGSPSHASLRVPEAGDAFVPIELPESLKISAAARVWGAPGQRRGLLVLGTEIPGGKDEAAVWGLVGRGQGEPPARLALPPVEPMVGMPELAPAREAPSIRIAAFNRVGERRKRDPLFGETVVETFVGFSGAKATAEDAHDEADRLNERLSRSAQARQEEFGTDRPFEVVWEIKAFRGGREIEVKVNFGGPEDVVVVPFRGQVAARVAVNPGGTAPQPELSAAVKTKSRLCGLLARSASDVQIVGRATVRFIGSRPVLARTDTFTSFTTPDRPTDEWAAVRAALSTFLPDGQDVQRRLERLQADACSPLPPGCDLPALAAHLETALRDPSTRFRALRELFDGDRSLARFVRLLGLAVIRDGLDSEELNLLKSLLEPARPDAQVERALPESAPR